ncbi:hypothetical protein [Ktedonospora formicarum]|uniref:hypothetical protein n=1 Tax=Ktedonospora formicarum TaxID=2778364 RepID=UPI001C68DD4D|nr:hypothetical protein [Ktedonospora formicarum]
MSLQASIRVHWLSTTVELAGTTVPEPLPVHDLVEADLWGQLPANTADLLAPLPRADLSLQDEMQVAFHPTLTRVWSRKGRCGQRLVEWAVSITKQNPDTTKSKMTCQQTEKMKAATPIS